MSNFEVLHMRGISSISADFVRANWKADDCGEGIKVIDSEGSEESWQIMVLGIERLENQREKFVLSGKVLLPVNRRGKFTAKMHFDPRRRVGQLKLFSE
jgi:hypothetical protein